MKKYRFICLFLWVLTVVSTIPTSAQFIAAGSANRDVIYVAVGRELYRSDNGGADWSNLSSFLRVGTEFRTLLPSNTFPERIVGWSTGSLRTLLISDTAGETWRDTFSNNGTFEGHGVRVFHVDPDDHDLQLGYAQIELEFSQLVYTSNGGLSWSIGWSDRPFPRKCYGEFFVNQFNSKEIIWTKRCAGDDLLPESWITRDGGHTSEAINLPYYIYWYFSPLGNESLAYTIGEESVTHFNRDYRIVRLTSDGGASWASLELPDGLPPDFVSITPDEENSVFGVRKNSGIQRAYRSIDFGKSWKEIGTVTDSWPAELKDVEAVDITPRGASLLFVYDDKSYRIMTPTGQVTTGHLDVTSTTIEKQLVSKFSELEIYPFPSSGYINIAGLKSQGRTKISIYNPLGHRISTAVVNPQMEKPRLNISYLKDGLYFFYICQIGAQCGMRPVLIVQ